MSEVETGVSDDSYIEIISGLQEGDTVAYLRTASSGADMCMMGGMPGGMSGGMPSWRWRHALRRPRRRWARRRRLLR